MSYLIQYQQILWGEELKAPSGSIAATDPTQTYLAFGEDALEKGITRKFREESSKKIHLEHLTLQMLSPTC